MQEYAAHLYAHTPHTPKWRLVAAFETRSTESNADTATRYIEGVIVNDNPTKRKSRKAVRKIANVVRDITICFCSGRGTLSP